MKNYVHPLLLQFSIFALLSGLALVVGCRQNPASNPPNLSPGDDPFFKEKNVQNNGDYLATFPLHHPDSCLLRVKNEIPEPLQAWACLSIWYHLPYNSPDVSFPWLDLYERNYPHDTVSAFTQMVRGEIMVDLGKHDSARTFLTNAKSRYLKLNRPLDASDADYLTAMCYMHDENHAKALESYFQVLELLNQHDTTFSFRHYNTYLGIGATYHNMKDYDKHLFWLKKAWHADQSKLDNAWSKQVMVANLMSAAYAQKEDFDSSLTMAKMAIRLFRDNSTKPLPGELTYRMGYAYFKKKDFSAALSYLRETSRGNANHTRTSTFMKNQMEQILGDCYLGLGRLDSAEIFLRASLATPDTVNLANAHRSLGQVYALRSDFRTAYHEEKEGSILFRRAFAIEKATAFSEFEARYETAQKEHRIRELEQKHQNEQQQKLIFALAALLALVFGTALVLRLRGRRRILEQQNLILEKNKTLLAQEKELAEAREILKIQELERAQEAHKKTQRTLKNTKDELQTTTHLLNLKNQLIEDLQMRLHDHQSASDDDPNEPDSTERLFKMKILTDTDWNRFRGQFEVAFPGFLQQLRIRFPDLSPAETRLFLLSKLKFSVKEISETLGISQDSVYRSRQRLGKKLDLTETREIDDFIEQFQ